MIPSRGELFFKRTIEDVLEKATGEIEVFPICDGYQIPSEDIIQDERVIYIHLPKTYKHQKRHGINEGVRQSKGTHIMSLDAHCLMARGFDEILTRDCEDNMVMIPRRNRLDAERWCIQKQSDMRPPIDYEYVMFPDPKLFKFHSFHGFRWDKRTKERWSIPIDDTMTMQASCWVMTKDHFQRNGFMQTEGFTGWGQEAESLCFKTWLRGGTVKTNKRTFYAHLHKGKHYGRMYHLDIRQTRASYQYSFDYFMNNRDPMRIRDFDWLIEKFWPLPGWPDNWKQRLEYKTKHTPIVQVEEISI